MGLFGYAIPQEWGGLGLNLAQDVELAMELGYTSLALRSMFGTNNGIAGQVLVGFGTDEQKARWLEAMASGDVVASFALTEPGAGSNPSGLRTKAVRDGGRLGDLRAEAVHHQRARRRPVRRLRPHPARRRPGPRHRRLPGARRRRRASRSAPRTPRWARRARGPPTSASTTSACRHDALIGGSEDIGYRAAMTSLARGRVHIAALAVGAAQRALDESVAYAATATQGGTPIGELPVGAGDDRRPADRRAGRPRARPRRRAAVGHRRGPPDRAVGGEAVLHRNGRQGRRSRGADPRRQRLHARRARSSASTATFGCCGCTRAPARSSV